jgi:hypothetical protein
MKYFRHSNSCIKGSHFPGQPPSYLIWIMSLNPRAGRGTPPPVHLGHLQLKNPAADRPPGLDRHKSPTGPPHEYASCVLRAPGIFASAFLPLDGACSRYMKNPLSASSVIFCRWGSRAGLRAELPVVQVFSFHIPDFSVFS